MVSGYCLSFIVNYLLTTYCTFKKKTSTGNLFGVIAAHMFNLFVVRMSLMWILVNITENPDKIANIADKRGDKPPCGKICRKQDREKRNKIKQL